MGLPKLPKLIQSSRPFFQWLNHILLNLMAVQPQSTSDIKVVSTKEGTKYYVSDDIKNRNNLKYPFKKTYEVPTDYWTSPTDYQTYSQNIIDSQNGSDATYYDPNLPYTVGTIVRVDTLKYAGPDKDPAKTDGAIYSYPGTYICVSQIPSGDMRKSGVIYAPVYPEPNLLASMNSNFYDSGSVKFVESQGRYWEVISLKPTFWTTCINGVEKTVLLNGCEVPASGSSVPHV